MMIDESFGQQNDFLSLVRLTFGIKILKICLPVHKGFGRSIAGVGNLKLWRRLSGIHINSYMTKSFSMKVSRSVISIAPSKLS